MYVVLKVQNLYSSLAQSVEHAAVNRSVVGSSPTGGAWCHSQVVRQRSATPLSPVQIRVAPLRKPWRFIFPGLICAIIYNNVFAEDSEDRQLEKRTASVMNAVR